MDNATYFDAIQRLARLCDPGSAGLYPVLGTVDVHFNEDRSKTILMATDRYTLGEMQIDFSLKNDEELEGKSNLLIPHGAATLVGPSKGNLLSTELIYESEHNRFGYSFSDGKIALFALQDSAPLSYESLKKSAEESTVNAVNVNVKELQRAIGVISSLVPDEDEIYLDISDSEIVVLDTNRTNRLAVEVSEGKLEDESYTVHFIRSVINKAFSPISTKELRLRWENVTGAFVFESILEDGTTASDVFVLAIPRS